MKKFILLTIATCFSFTSPVICMESLPLLGFGKLISLENQTLKITGANINTLGNKKKLSKLGDWVKKVTQQKNITKLEIIECDSEAEKIILQAVGKKPAKSITKIKLQNYLSSHGYIPPLDKFESLEKISIKPRDPSGRSPLIHPEHIPSFKNLENLKKIAIGSYYENEKKEKIKSASSLFLHCRYINFWKKLPPNINHIVLKKFLIGSKELVDLVTNLKNLKTLQANVSSWETDIFFKRIKKKLSNATLDLIEYEEKKITEIKITINNKREVNFVIPQLIIPINDAEKIFTSIKQK